MQKLSDDDIHSILDHFGKTQLQVMSQASHEDAVKFADPLMVHFQSSQQETKKINQNDLDELQEDPVGDSCQLDQSLTYFLQNVWHELFDIENYLTVLREKAVQGRLGHSPYRGVCWKLFWECLPEKREQWMDVTKQLRADYEKIRDKHLTDPYQSPGMDVAVNNPLSQEKESPWHQYFQDGELRNTIYQDVERLYPEMDFFRKKEIDDMILRCLFIYAKEHPNIVYKQGMHEMIAPVIYVLWENAQNVKDSNEDLQEIIHVINDQKYVEHDSFWLFSEIMDSVEPMFVNHRQIPDEENNGWQKVADVDNLFVASAPNQPTSAISKKLTRIQNYMLKRYDHELYSRLQELEIAPQVYGIRWIRLLFGREYPLSSLLYLWDAMFADGRTLDLADFIYIAMLIHIRRFLLKNEYSTCLMQLMKYPTTTDAKLILRKALSLRTSKPNSDRNKHPINKQRKVMDRNASLRRTLSESLTEEQKFAHALGSGRRQVADSFRPKSKAKPSQWYADTSDGADQRETVTTTIGSRKESFSQQIKRTQREGNNLNESETLVEKSEAKRTDKMPRAQALKSAMVSQISNAIGRHTTGLSNDVLSKFGSRNKNRSKDSVSQLEEDHERLQRQISQLQSEFDMMQSLCLFCAGKMDSYLGFIDFDINEKPLENEVTKSCIDGLKKVRDILARTTELEASTESYERRFAAIDRNLSAAFPGTNPESSNILHGEDVHESPLPVLTSKENHFGAATSKTNTRVTEEFQRASEIQPTAFLDSIDANDPDEFDYTGYRPDNGRTNQESLSKNDSDCNISDCKSNSSTPSSPTPESWGYLKPADSPGDFERELLSIKDKYRANPNDPSDESGTALEYVAFRGNSFASQTGTNDETNESLDPLSALEKHLS